MHGMRHHGEALRKALGGTPVRTFRRGPRLGPAAARAAGGDWFRVGRMLAQGDLKLLALALIAEQPRHGYELIKLIEEKTSGAYSPSPGVVYPTLTFLEEAGYVTAEAEGAKKRYTITEEGRAYLEENRDIADMVLARLEAIGKKLARRRRGWEERHGEGRRARCPSSSEPRSRICATWRRSNSKPRAKQATPKLASSRS